VVPGRTLILPWRRWCYNANMWTEFDVCVGTRPAKMHYSRPPVVVRGDTTTLVEHAFPIGLRMAWALNCDPFWLAEGDDVMTTR